MNIIIVTPNEPFYLSNNIDYLVRNLNSQDKLIGCVLLNPTPYGKRLNFFQKANRTFKIFGLKFFIYYTVKFILVTFFSRNVEQVLRQHKIPIIRLSKNINSKDSITILRQFNPDLIISVLGNEIFKKSILELPKNGCINLHTSHLPKYRGMMPTFWTMLNDEKEIGVSVFIMDEGIDSGPIIDQELVPISKSDSQKDIITKTKSLGMRLILNSIEKIRTGKVEFISNDDEKSTYYTYPKKEDVMLFRKKGKKFF